MPEYKHQLADVYHLLMSLKLDNSSIAFAIQQNWCTITKSNYMAYGLYITYKNYKIHLSHEIIDISVHYGLNEIIEFISNLRNLNDQFIFMICY